MEASRDDFKDLSTAVWRMIDSTRRGFARVVDPVRYGILQLVAARERVRPTEVAAGLDIVASSVTRHVQTLEEFGLVTTVGNPDDRRSSLVEITDAGRQTLHDFSESGIDVLVTVLEDWTREDVRALTSLLHRLTDAWEHRGPARQRPVEWGRGMSRAR